MTKYLKKTTFSDNVFLIKGLISKKPRLSSSLQLIYVNNRVISKGSIHKVVNEMISNHIKEMSIKSASSLEEKIVLKSLINPTHNVYIIKIYCSLSEYEIFTTNLRKNKVKFKNWDILKNCFRKAIKKVFHNASKTIQSKLVSNKIKSDNVTKHGWKNNTNCLINAIKGKLVKRKHEESKKKSICKEYVSSSKLIKSHNDETKSNGKLAIGYGLSQNCDSIESPIPKKKLKLNLETVKSGSNLNNFKIDVEEVLKSMMQNITVFEFYNWIKEKMNGNSGIANFYDNLVQYHSREKNFSVRQCRIIRNEISEDENKFFTRKIGIDKNVIENLNDEIYRKNIIFEDKKKNGGGLLKRITKIIDG